MAAERWTAVSSQEAAGVRRAGVAPLVLPVLVVLVGLLAVLLVGPSASADPGGSPGATPDRPGDPGALTTGGRARERLEVTDRGTRARRGGRGLPRWRVTVRPGELEVAGVQATRRDPTRPTRPPRPSRDGPAVVDPVPERDVLAADALDPRGHRISMRVQLVCSVLLAGGLLWLSAAFRVESRRRQRR